MAGLASIRGVLQEEYVYKVDDRISRGRINLGVRIEVGMLDDTL
jgi:hypothetical protein